MKKRGQDWYLGSRVFVFDKTSKVSVKFYDCPVSMYSIFKKTIYPKPIHPICVTLTSFCPEVTFRTKVVLLLSNDTSVQPGDTSFYY